MICACSFCPRRRRRAARHRIWVCRHCVSFLIEPSAAAQEPWLQPAGGLAAELGRIVDGSRIIVRGGCQCVCPRHGRCTQCCSNCVSFLARWVASQLLPPVCLFTAGVLCRPFVEWRSSLCFPAILWAQEPGRQQAVGLTAQLDLTAEFAQRSVGGGGAVRECVRLWHRHRT